jgi:hypothetical protein
VWRVRSMEHSLSGESVGGMRVCTRLSHGMSDKMKCVGSNAWLVVLVARVRRGGRGAAVLLHGALALRRKCGWDACKHASETT